MKIKNWIKNSFFKKKSFWKKINFDHEKKKSSKKRILVANLASGHSFCKIVETSIAVALKIRGCDVEFLQCDKVLKACVMCTSHDYKNYSEFLEDGSSKFCNYCWDQSKKDFIDTKLKVNVLGDYINPEEINKIIEFFNKIDLKKLNINFQFQNIKIGEQAIAACYRFLGKPIFENQIEEKIKRKYFISAAITVVAIKNLLKKKKFDSILCNHGIYVPHGTVIDVAMHLGIRTICYGKGYRKNTLIFSNGETYHKSMIDEKNSLWKDIEITKKKEKKLINYIKSRKYGTEDWTVYLNDPKKLNHSILEKIKEKPTITILTNVTWDAQVFYKNNVFKNINDWLIYTIKYFLNRKDLNIIIRIHPGEISGTVPSKQKIEDLIKSNFKKLPDNFLIIKSSDKTSTYDLTDLSNCSIIYGTKMGVEITPFGKNVIVCGEAWIKNKNITIDIKNKKMYRKILDSLPFDFNLSSRKILLAKKYSYHYFFRRMIKVDFIKFIEKNNRISYDYGFNSINELKRGKHKGIDTICDAIINEKKEFILDV